MGWDGMGWDGMAPHSSPLHSSPLTSHPSPLTPHPSPLAPHPSPHPSSRVIARMGSVGADAQTNLARRDFTVSLLLKTMLTQRLEQIQ